MQGIERSWNENVPRGFSIDSNAHQNPLDSSGSSAPSPGGAVFDMTTPLIIPKIPRKNRGVFIARYFSNEEVVQISGATSLFRELPAVQSAARTVSSDSIQLPWRCQGFWPRDSGCHRRLLTHQAIPTCVFPPCRPAQ